MWNGHYQIRHQRGGMGIRHVPAWHQQGRAQCLPRPHGAPAQLESARNCCASTLSSSIGAAFCRSACMFTSMESAHFSALTRRTAVRSAFVLLIIRLDSEDWTREFSWRDFTDCCHVDRQRVLKKTRAPVLEFAMNIYSL